MNAASSDAKNATAPATSPETPRRGMACLTAMTRAVSSSWSPNRSSLVGPDRAGSTALTVIPLGPKLAREQQREADERALRRHVVQEARLAQPERDRPDVHDPPGRRRREMRERGADHQERAFRVHRHHVVPVRLGDLGPGAVGSVSAALLTTMSSGRSGRWRRRRARSQSAAGATSERIATAGVPSAREPGGERLGHGLVAAVQNTTRAVPGQPLDARGADPAGAAGDDGDAAGEPRSRPPFRTSAALQAGCVDVVAGRCLRYHDANPRFAQR